MKHRNLIIGLLLWLALFGLALAWRVQNLDAFGLANDEGAHVMWAKLAADGYPLYTQTQAVQSSLFLEVVRVAFWLAGPTLAVGRWAMLTGFLLLAVALSGLAYRGGKWLSACVTMFLLGVSPLVFAFSRLVMAEVPAVGLAVTSLALCFVYFYKRHKAWLLASGFVLGLSFITKALNPFVALPVGLLLLTLHFGHDRVRVSQKLWRLILDGALWSLAVILPVAIVPFIYGPAAVYDQLVLFRGDLRAADPGSWLHTWRTFEIFVWSHWGLWLLAVSGTMLAAVKSYLAQRNIDDAPNTFVFLSQNRRYLYPLVWTVWLLGGIVMLLWHTPLFPHHFIVLLPPLILLSAGFIADIVTVSRQWKWAYALWVVVAVAALNLVSMAQSNQETAAIVTGGREDEALKLLQAVSAPNDFLMGDSQLLIFMANRRTPPPLGDVALVAIKAGRQTSARMTALTEQYQSPAVVQWSLRLPWLPEYLAWTEENYFVKRVWDNDHIIFYAPRYLAGQPIPNERTDPLGDALTLRGYDLDEASIKNGDALNLKIYWQTDAPLEKDYTVFIQLLDSNGAYVSGKDSQPLGGYFPTSQWPPDEIITDVIQFPLPADLPPGDYTLITGMYVLDTGQRLTQPNGSDHIVLTPLTIP